MLPVIPPILPASNKVDYLLDLAEILVIHLMEESGSKVLKLEKVVDFIVEKIPSNLPVGRETVEETLSLISANPKMTYRLKARTNRILHDGTSIHLLDEKYWFREIALPSARPPLQKRKLNLPDHISNLVFDPNIRFEAVRGFWFRLKQNKGLLISRLGQMIVEDYGCFVTFLLQCCRTYRPHWNETDVNIFETRLKDQIMQRIKSALSLCSALDLPYISFYTFGVPLLVDSDLINSFLNHTAVNYAQDGLFLKSGPTEYYTNPGEMDEDWNSLEPEDAITENLKKLGDDDIMSVYSSTSRTSWK